MEFDGNQLSISYNISSENTSDRFYVWLELVKLNGEIIVPEALSGDIGEKIRAGNNKKVIWIPEQDSVFLNERILVEVKAEKYIRSFNRGSATLQSMLYPGWGQKTISNDKPWFLTGAVIYGTMATGFIFNLKSHTSYNNYVEEEDFDKRADLLDKANNERKLASTMIYSAAAAWAVNVLWVALTPGRYQPLQHTKISLYQPNASDNRGVMLSLQFNF